MKTKYFCVLLPLLTAVDLHPSFAYPPTVDPTYGMESPPSSTPEPPVPETLPSKWIWSDKTANETIYVRATASLAKTPKSAALYVTADDSFEVYINGHKVAATPLPAADLAWSNVQRIDVAKALTAGANVIAARAVNQGGAAGFLARLDVDGKEVLTTGEQWRLSDQSDLPATWNQAGFDDSGWTKATVVAPLGQGPWGGGLNDWAGSASKAPYMAHMTFAPKSLTAVTGAAQFAGLDTLNGKSEVKLKVTPDGEPVLLVDFGQEIAGRCRIYGTDGASISITTGESREECDHSEPALDNSGPYNLTLAGQVPTSTPYSAFRYVKITFHGTTPVVLTQIVCDHKYYPVKYLGSFDCSDPLLTRIWYAGAYTAHLCMQEDIWDAPKRDRGLWIGDLQVTGQTINDVFADKFLMEQSIEKVRDLAQHGKPANELPAADVNDLPGYSAAWFCTLADFHRHVGDLDYLKRQHEKIVSLLEWEQTKFDDKNVYLHNAHWEFVDWAPNFVLDSPVGNATTHFYIIYGVREAVYLLREIGDTANADKYAEWADRLTSAAHSQFANVDTHTFGNRIQENTMAVLSGVATPEDQHAIYDQVLAAKNSQWQAHEGPDIDYSSVITPYYGYFVLNALDKVDQQQAGVDLIRRYWGEMMRRGATTLWEKFDPAWPEDLKLTLDKMPYLSLSHGWATGPTSYLTQTVLGVRPTAAGYRAASIHPRLGDLTWAEGDVPTPHGLIHVRIDRKGPVVTAKVKLPADITATITVGTKSIHADHAGSYELSDTQP